MAYIAASALRLLFDFLVSINIEKEDIEKLSGVQYCLLKGDFEKHPIERWYALIQAGNQLSNDPNLAFRFGEALNMEQYIDMCAVVSKTVGEALEIGRRMNMQIDESGQLYWKINEKTSFLVFDYKGPEECQLFMKMQGAIVISRFIQGLIGEKTSFVKVCFPFKKPKDMMYYRIFFAEKSVFSAKKSGMVIKNKDMARRITRQVPNINNQLSNLAKYLIQTKDKETDQYLLKIKNTILRLLPMGRISVEQVCCMLQTGRQTLYRRLKQNNTTFQKLLDEIRKDLVLDYLKNKEYSIKEVSYLLGYSHPVIFSRKFKKWFHQTPLAYRNSM